MWLTLEVEAFGVSLPQLSVVVFGFEKPAGAPIQPHDGQGLPDAAIEWEETISDEAAFVDLDRKGAVSLLSLPSISPHTYMHK